MEILFGIVFFVHFFLFFALADYFRKCISILDEKFQELEKRLDFLEREDIDNVNT